jgi:hypothetical protein
MTDLVYLALTLVFFAASYGLIAICDRLMQSQS